MTDTKDMAALYEVAWEKLFHQKEKRIQQYIIEEPHGRHAAELAKEVAKEAESWYSGDDDQVPF